MFESKNRYGAFFGNTSVGTSICENHESEILEVMNQTAHRVMSTAGYVPTTKQIHIVEDLINDYASAKGYSLSFFALHDEICRLFDARSFA
ncbi:MAG: hypothetical protein LBD38_05100 [Streptococcaceae bacterium]|jgi:hypothetical protein|nr:hypothetical protein [Streptococcaceae bacterium]